MNIIGVMDAVTTRIPMEKIQSATNRPQGGDGDIALLARSLEEHGLIQPVVVCERPDGAFSVIAGRRRYAAARSLGWESIEAVILPADADRDAIALAENVNRLDMSPLDEAEMFSHLLKEGKSAGELAERYSRSVSGILQRARLAGLTAGVKTMLREEKISLASAAVIAGLPEPDQEKFSQTCGKRPVDKWTVLDFIRKTQRLVLNPAAGPECEACADRTRNDTPGLFEAEGYAAGLREVCFNGECYAENWKARIAEAVAALPKKKRDVKCLILGEGIPPFLPPGAKTLAIGGAEYAALDYRKQGWRERNVTVKDKRACLIKVENGTGKVKAAPVYLVEPDPPAPSAPGGKAEARSLVTEYQIDRVSGVKEEDRKRAAAAVAAEYQRPEFFARAVNNAVLNALIEKRIKEEARENLAAAYLAWRFGDGNGDWDSPEHAALFSRVFADTSIVDPEDIPLEDELVQRLFMFIILAGPTLCELPRPEECEGEWEKIEGSLFWKFAQTTREEYDALWRAAREKLVMEAAAKAGREAAWAID